jgi:hypothetical protein
LARNVKQDILHAARWPDEAIEAMLSAAMIVAKAPHYPGCADQLSQQMILALGARPVGFRAHVNFCPAQISAGISDVYPQVLHFQRSK